MRAAHEALPLPGGGAVLTRRTRRPSFNVFWHRHPELELTRIDAGGGQRMVGASVADFEAGDLVLVGANLPHTWRSIGSGDPERSEACRASVIQFRREPVAAAAAAFPELAGVSLLLEAAGAGIWFPPGLSDAAIDAVLDAGTDRAAVPGLLLLLLAELAGAVRRGEASPLDGSLAGRGGAGEPVADEKVEAMVRLLQARASETRGPTLEEVAAAASLSPSAAARRFKRAMGRTPTDYPQGLRVAAACDRLRSTDEPIIEVAWAAGFGNLSHFHRVFRRATGETPRAWRARVRGMREAAA